VRSQIWRAAGPCSTGSERRCWSSEDARLVLDAARRHDFDAALIATVAERMEQAIDLGHGEEDMAATYWASADGASGGDSTGP